MRKSTCFFVGFLENSPESEQQAINTDFTFELFICAAILLDHRETLLQCRDEMQLIQFTSRFVAWLRYVSLFFFLSHHRFSIFLIPQSQWWHYCCIHFGCSLQGTLDLNSTLKKAEHLLYNYCKRYAWDYINGHWRAQKTKEEDFFYQLRNFLVLKWLLFLFCFLFLDTRETVVGVCAFILSWNAANSKCTVFMILVALLNAHGILLASQSYMGSGYAICYCCGVGGTVWHGCVNMMVEQV